MKRPARSRRKPPLPNGARAVMASRLKAKNDLDPFWTPPWATRALCEIVLRKVGWGRIRQGVREVWEPACGEGHMAEPLKEYFGSVHATDLADYGYGPWNCDFLKYQPNFKIDWIITNPPFGKLTLPFINRALELARCGVAMFVRTQWATEGVQRYEHLFRYRPPTLTAFFSERVPLCKGKWDPDGSTATSYCWLVWTKDPQGNINPEKPVFRIPPGQRKALTLSDDRERFAAWSLPHQEAAE